MGGILRNPGAPWLLGLLLFIDVLSLPDSTVVGSLTRDGGTRCRVLPSAMMLVRDESGLRLVEDDWGDAALLTMVAYRSGTTESGFWAPTRRVETHALRLNNYGLMPGEEDAARRLFADYMLTWRDGRMAHEAALIRGGDRVVRTILWSGYAHNAGALLVFAAMCASLRYLVIGQIEAHRRARRSLMLSRGVCPGCGYDLSGLVGGATCPECGGPVT